MTERELLDLCQRRGITVRRVGQSWRISGRGVSILATDLRWIRERDLQPAYRAVRDEPRDEAAAEL